MEDEFAQWVIRKAINMDCSEMCEDHMFVSRLFNDVLWGRSKRFNRTKRSEGINLGLDALKVEFEAETSGGNNGTDGMS